jgi:hypothetical protein
VSKIRLWLDRNECAPGDTVSGRVDVVEGGSCRSLTVALEFREKADVYDAVARTVPAEAPLQTGELTEGASLPFSITLPADAPPTFRSAHGRLFWVVKAQADQRGRDAVSELELRVAAAAAHAPAG